MSNNENIYRIYFAKYCRYKDYPCNGNFWFHFRLEKEHEFWNMARIQNFNNDGKETRILEDVRDSFNDHTVIEYLYDSGIIVSLEEEQECNFVQLLDSIVKDEYTAYKEYLANELRVRQYNAYLKAKEWYGKVDDLKTPMPFQKI